MSYFWAKTTPDGRPGISVYDHMVNVGCVAQCIAETSPEILARFYLQLSAVGALAALHDLGKISPGFQRKCEAWLGANDLAKVARNGCWDNEMESDHGKVSHSAVQQFLTQKKFPRKTAKFLSAVLGAHHGRLNPPKEPIYVPPGKRIIETVSGIDWDAARMTNAEKVWGYFGECSSELELDDETPALWWLAGLTTVADWIGSNERFFSPGGHDFGDVSSLAQMALDAIGWP